MNEKNEKIFPGSLGDRLKHARLFRKMTLVEFGEKIGVSNAFLSGLERGKKQPSEQLLWAIEYRLGIRKGWLLTGEGPMEREEAPSHKPVPIEDAILDLILAYSREFGRMRPKRNELG